jgi:hypothetical protein
MRSGDPESRRVWHLVRRIVKGRLGLAGEADGKLTPTLLLEVVSRLIQVRARGALILFATWYPSCQPEHGSSAVGVETRKPVPSRRNAANRDSKPAETAAGAD